MTLDSQLPWLAKLPTIPDKPTGRTHFVITPPRGIPPNWRAYQGQGSTADAIDAAQDQAAINNYWN